MPLFFHFICFSAPLRSNRVLMLYPRMASQVHNKSVNQCLQTLKLKPWFRNKATKVNHYPMFIDDYPLF